MPNTILINDPHLGLTRSRHTSRSSADAYRRAVYYQAASLASMSKARGDYVLCGGDVFDTKYNNERTIEHGTNFLDNVDFCLAGNHDLSNNTEAFSSLQLCDTQMRLLRGDSPVILEPSVWAPGDTNLQVLGVPHMLSQGEFEQAVFEWVPKFVKGCLNPKAFKVLLLHCNWNMPSEWQHSDTALNLTVELAGWCRKNGIDQIILGHEHRGRYPMEGFVQIPGSIFPTAFDNMDDKYVWKWVEQGEERGFITERVWDRSKRYAEVTAGEIPPEFPPEIQFVKVIGSVPQTGYLEMAQTIERSWKSSPEVLAINISAKSESATFTRDIGGAQPGRLSMRDVIEGELSGKPEMLALWKKVTEGL